MTDYDEKMEARPIGAYLDDLASCKPTPGGGSVAGLVGALAAGLAEMVISLTPDASPELEGVADDINALRASAIASGAADELAYGGYVEATKLPKSTEEEKAYRKGVMQEALHQAAEVPLELASTALTLLEHIRPVIRHGSKHVLSDAAIAITLAVACVDVSLVNVRVNVPLIKDVEFAGSVRGKAQQIEQQAHSLAEELRAALSER